MRGVVSAGSVSSSEKRSTTRAAAKIRYAAMTRKSSRRAVESLTAEGALSFHTDRRSGDRRRGTRSIVGVPRRYRVTVPIFDAVLVLAVAVAVVAVWGLSMRLVGQVAEEFGEDPARWRLLMLPFGILGPVVARVLLSRNDGGRGGFS